MGKLTYVQTLIGRNHVEGVLIFKEFFEIEDHGFVLWRSAQSINVRRRMLVLLKFLKVGIGVGDLLCLFVGGGNDWKKEAIIFWR